MLGWGDSECNTLVVESLSDSRPGQRSLAVICMHVLLSMLEVVDARAQADLDPVPSYADASLLESTCVIFDR